MAKRERAQGLRCPRMPGEVFNSRADADDMRVTRQINAVTGGMGQGVYHVKKCSCERWHVITDEHLRKWEATRRAAQRERRRNA